MAGYGSRSCGQNLAIKPNAITAKSIANGQGLMVAATRATARGA